MTSQVMQRRAYLGHAKLFLNQLKKWNAAISTPRCLESLNAIESTINNITVAFLRTINPNELGQPEMTRDFAIMLFDYYDKRSLWDQWGNDIGPHGLSACERLGDIYSMNEAYPTICNCFGIVHRMQGNNSEAMHFYELALSRAGSDRLKSDALTNMADIYRLQGQADRALQCAQQAIQLGKNAGDSNREAKGLEYLGLTYTLLGDYDEAIKLYELALILREEVGNLPRIALVLTQLSYALTHRGQKEDLHQALFHYRRSYAIDRQMGNWQSVARYWGDVAVTYTKLDEYQKAIDNLEQALDRNETIGFRRGVALNHVRLTENFLNLSNYEKALFHCEQACRNLQYLTNFDRKLALAGFSNALLNLGRYMQACSKLTEAIAYAKLAIELATEVEANNIQQAAMHLLQRLESPIDKESADF
ncbi:MAG TPA: tetratricopeptide repeat protein [Ktedonobacteraceae bacterium]|nr:tetratricopeptide repeat protein [Ktedonobacteraceae bacterium]